MRGSAFNRRVGGSVPGSSCLGGAQGCAGSSFGQKPLPEKEPDQSLQDVCHFIYDGLSSDLHPIKFIQANSSGNI